MKKALLTLYSILFSIALVQAQTMHTVSLNGIAFTPNNLTINVGDMVQWSNMSGTHNVNGSTATFPNNPAGFGNGNAAPSPWSFSHTFTVPGVYQYRCDPHASLGMTGSITVNGAASGDVIITEINYNSPGGGLDTFEFVELYNKGTVAVNLEGWRFVSGINYTFPSYDLNPGQFVVVANFSDRFNSAFGFTPLDWDAAGNNVLNNTSENIILVNADSSFIDSVRYADNIPWPTSADGQGPSLVLCDFNADNGNPANWAAAITGTGFTSAGVEILANPGAVSGCASGPVVGFSLPSATVPESAGDVFVSVSINGGNANPTQVTLSVNPMSTATAGNDYNANFPITLTFAAGVAAEAQTITIPIVSDTDIEPNEMLVLDITNATNGATIGSGNFMLNISDDDTPLSGALLISGVFDAQPGAAGAKGVELKALADIPDLSIYGVGSASNGGGSDGVEITLPAISISAGECVYLVADSALFATYFGLTAIATGNGVNINGDDAIELFENGQVIDVFGDITYPAGGGANQLWNYLDGWAYRKDGTGPDGVLFDISHWNVNANALNGGTTNATAPMPFPVCQYSIIPPSTAELVDDSFTVPAGTSTNLDVLNNDVLPLTINSIGINAFPMNGTVEINGFTDIIYTPADGYCGPDSFVYEVCDNGGCDQATVTVTVECPATYPAYDIADVTTVSNGAPDSLGVSCELSGIVYGIDYQGVSAQGDPIPAVQFYLNDGTGGISVFGTQAFGYVVKEGDAVTVRGRIVNFNCLTQIAELDTIIFESANNPLLSPELTTFLNESHESELVRFTNMELVNPSAWTPAGTGFNVQIRSIVNPNANPITMRIDNDCELFNMPAPTVPFHATGIGGQFVSGGGGGCLDGYQFLPRFVSDIELLNPTDESILVGKISFFPNPVGAQLYFKSEIMIEDILVSNALGQQMLRVAKPTNSIAVGQLQAGIYLITFQAEGAVWTSKFVKE
ncbi:MAG: lamin tail domain-containing protein [Saprospiraceae bacterium]|nr:lamin tail domain-containing protein [Saprospiraceae bacterium]